MEITMLSVVIFALTFTIGLGMRLVDRADTSPAQRGSMAIGSWAEALGASVTTFIAGSLVTAPLAVILVLAGFR